jgi:cytidylate kinase
MSIITLSRELGSRGDDIAVAVAERLGLRLVGRELLNRAARQAGAPEVALAEIDELGLLGVRPSARALRLYRQTVETIIHEMADTGNLLLVGRGGQIVLAGRPGVLHVRVTAPREQRVAQVQMRCGVPAEVAAARVDASDRARAGYLRRHYGVRWDDPARYDLALNTAHMDVETAVEIICLAAQNVTTSPPCPPLPRGEREDAPRLGCA